MPVFQVTVEPLLFVTLDSAAAASAAAGAGPGPRPPQVMVVFPGRPASVGPTCFPLYPQGYDRSKCQACNELSRCVSSAASHATRAGPGVSRSRRWLRSNEIAAGLVCFHIELEVQAALISDSDESARDLLRLAGSESDSDWPGLGGPWAVLGPGALATPRGPGLRLAAERSMPPASVIHDLEPAGPDTPAS